MSCDRDLVLVETAFEERDSFFNVVQVVENAMHILDALVHEELADILGVELVTQLSGAQMGGLDNYEAMAGPPVDDRSVALVGGEVAAWTVAVRKKDDGKV
jgi:hypothetical protein